MPPARTDLATAVNSALRTPEQTETAKFWLMTGPQAYHPIVRELISARHMKLVDSARFMAAFAAALTDGYIAVFDAKYHYDFWRPITAIRNGDIDGNPQTTVLRTRRASRLRVGRRPQAPSSLHDDGKPALGR